MGIDTIFSKKHVDIVTASKIEKAPLVSIDAISVTDKTEERVDVLVHDLPKNSYVDGLLGLSFLRNFNIYIDFKEGILEIE